MKNISPKEDAKLFKQLFWNLFTVSNWFNTLTDNKHSQGSSVNGSMCLSAYKKSPPLEHGIKDSDLIKWLRDNIGLTAKLAKEIDKLFEEQCAEHIHIDTTWNKAAKRSQEK